MERFQGKVAVVTGAASGIGLALAERFAAEGMKLVLADVEAEPLARAERDLRARGADVLAVRTDVSQAADVEALAEQTLATFGAVHVVCNNAGVVLGGATWEHTIADWEWVLGVNLWGVIHGVRVFVPIMLRQGTEGHVVNTASLSGLRVVGYNAIYAVSKFGVVALSESLYHELDALPARIKVSVLCPGVVRTNILEAARNRPGPFENPAVVEGTTATPEMLARRQQIRDKIRDSLVNGPPPSEIAEQVLRAIREERFYVLPHDEFDDQLRARTEAILARGNPPDPQLWLGLPR
jgi:NAD(P)-dependent dehydrogenase (short-subunit alcohol dehydrogenase family)